VAVDGSRKAIIAAFFANLGIAATKFIAFLITGAASMAAEALHSVADTGNQALLLFGAARARRTADQQHPFGYGRDRYFWAFVVSLVLFMLGGVFALYEGINKLRHPHELERPEVAVAVLVVAIVLESLSFRTAIQAANQVRAGQSWRSFVKHSKSPELPVVLLEDAGALLGLWLALGGIGVAALTENPRYDALGSIGIGVLLVVIAGVLATEMKSLLIGESATGSDLTSIRQALEQGPGVRRVIYFRTQHLGPEELLVAAKLAFDESLTTRQLADAIDSTEASIRESVPIARVIYIEPDVDR